MVGCWALGPIPLLLLAPLHTQSIYCYGASGVGAQSFRRSSTYSIVLLLLLLLVAVASSGALW